MFIFNHTTCVNTCDTQLISHQPGVTPQFRWLWLYCHLWHHQKLLPLDRV